MGKGYPRSRFDLVDQTQVQEIRTSAAPNPTAVVMMAYTSDKGGEDWEYMYGLTNFTTSKGGINFNKHGQAQLIVAEVLRNGGYVFGKRMVSSDATIGNTTVRAKVVVASGVSYLYLYTVSATAVGNIDDAGEAGYDGFDVNDTNATDFPLFTITPTGRGASNIFFRIVPEYSTSKSSSTLKYTLEVWENQEMLESILFTMNPDVVIDEQSQSLQAKINNNSTQIRVKLFEDGVYGLVRKLAQTANINGEPIPVNSLVNYDFVNGKDRRNGALGGIVAEAASAASGDLWTTNIPSGITPIALDNGNGIPLSNGSYGTMGTSPIANQNEYTNLLLGVWGKNPSSEQFDPVIYDLDAYKPDAVFDAAYPVSVKNAIIDVCDFRGDMVFLADMGTTLMEPSQMFEYADGINNSKFRALYHNFFKVINPYTRKEITVTMPYLLAKRFVKHTSGGISRPFAGFANEIYFPEIIKGSINYLPVIIPGEDQKQKLVDHNINYLSMYDGVAVMETMYTGQPEYTQLSYLHNVLATQEVIKAIRTRCPRTRYTNLDGSDLENYLKDAEAVVNAYRNNFKEISIKYMGDPAYEANNIFYATLAVVYRNFVQEEYYKIYAITNTNN